MRMRARGKSLGPLVLVGAMALAPSIARAEADTFGIGDGADGAHTAATLGEVVNVYAAVGTDVAAGATSITIQAVVPSGTFANGDLVLVWRATGVGDTEAGAESGNQTGINLATAAGGVVGKFEFAKVSGGGGSSTLTLSAPLVNAWAKDVTQVVKVPRFTTVSVPNTTSLAAAPWQPSGTGIAGGILAFLANGAVTIDSGGRLDADGAGFRGGAKLNRTTPTVDCGNMDGTVDQGYAPKGEGVVTSKFGGTDNGGRGNRSLGAGGGNCVENGGGGGGNFAKGGTGGDSSFNAIAGTPHGGLGGSALTYSLLARMSFGGGGGAGEQKNSLGSSGGNGGGVIFVRAKSVANSGTISANGISADNPALLNVDSDGAGGGGAGGNIVLRVVDDVTCGGGGVVQANGGKGGDTSVTVLAPTSVWGPGGGGAGGRVLVQAKTNGCTPSTAAGAGGTSAGAARNATAGGGGTTEPAVKPGTTVTSGYCFSNPTSDPQCATAQPVCDVTSGFCDKCNGAFGSGASSACPTATKPVCNSDGTCVGCTGDFPAAGGCQTIADPTCVLAGPNQGECIKCTTNTDCAGHPGTICDTVSGACGTACQSDADCDKTHWCTGQGVCVPKTPNGDPVSNDPPVNGMCTPDNGRRTCISGVCEMSDNDCGLKNGDPCNSAGECRSDICFTDGDCGLPSGQPCAGDQQCRSDRCDNGVCTGCMKDNDCGQGQVCDTMHMQCVPGCKNDQNCPPPQICSQHDGSVGQCINPPVGEGGPSDGGFLDTSGIVEGGGCSCRTASLAGAGRPLGVGALAAAVLLFVRRRKTRSTRST